MFKSGYGQVFFIIMSSQVKLGHSLVKLMFKSGYGQVVKIGHIILHMKMCRHPPPIVNA